jgi:hypothetical protein
MTSSGTTILGTLLLLGLLAMPRNAVSEDYTVDLRSAHDGNLPDGFVPALTGRGGPAVWAVRDDPTAPGGKVLAQTSAEPTDYRFPLLIDRNLSAKNVVLTVRFKPVSGRVDRAAGLVARLEDKDNYYVVRANALEDNIRLYKVVKGERRQFAGVNAKIVSGQWQELGLKLDGNQFEVSFNGDAIFTARDDTFTRPGNIGLWTKADSVTYFTDLTARTLP